MERLMSGFLLLMLATGILCQEGLGGDSFDPVVKASCAGGRMNVQVVTKHPFSGIIHGPNRTEPGCAVLGQGDLKTTLTIPLTRVKGQPGSCGVIYNQLSEEHRAAVAVRAHPTIELLEDKLYKVTCGRAGFQNSLNKVSVVTLKIAPPGDESFKAKTVLEGESYLLRAEVMDNDAKYGILVRKCYAFDDLESSVVLVDDRGCSDGKLISPFEYDQDEGTATATIHTMFRLPHANRTYFQCEVAICEGGCAFPDCSSEASGRLAVAGGPISSIKDGSTGVDLFAPPEDDAVTTSTSVFVAEPGTPEYFSAYYCPGGLGVSGDSNWLVWLCIAFGVLFAIMLLINIFLCSAMTCSCTRSEIIEKEPSIYDDYSLYDSHYGYTNGKAYGSESDYGSEYGVDGGADGTNGQGGAGSHRGGGVGGGSEYQGSKYGGGAGGNSTLSRSRH